MTSLAHQLKRLALPQSDPDLLTRSEVASLLFDPKDAATIDRSTFYALGCTGLEELLGIEPSFLEFQDTLFSRAALTLERSVQSKDVNAKLDAGISLFLTRLSPYFLLKPAHKCLEWLIHRFHVHLYNVDSLLACVLPYHDTKVFVRVLQLLKVSDSTHRWNWLHCLQKPGVPLSRAALITHCFTDLSFMDFICTMVTRSVQAYSGHWGSCPQLRVIFSFYASTMVSALDAVDSVSDVIISKLLPFVQRGLKSSLSDYKAASYMLLCQLSVKVVMDTSLVDSLSVHISRSLLKEPVLAQEGLGSFIVLLQHQKEGVAGHRALSLLCSMPALVSTLQVMAVAHDVSALLRHLLPHLIQQLFTTGETETDDLSLLDSVLKTVPLTKGLDQTVARLLLDKYLSVDMSPEDVSVLHQRLQPLVRLFESRYSDAMDAVLAGHVTDLSRPQHKLLFHHFLSLSLSSGRFQVLEDTDTSLFLSLKHRLSSVRVSAVQSLMDVFRSQSVDMSFVKDAVSDGLGDDVPEVVSAALSVLEELFDVLDAEDTETWGTCLLSLMHRVDVSVCEQWLPVMKQTVRLLSHSQLGKVSAERLQTLGWKLLPFLVITDARPDSAQMILAVCVGQSPVLARHPLTLNWTQEMEQTLKKTSHPDFVGLINERLVFTLKNNLENMEHFSKRDALEKLSLLVEEQRGSALRDQMSFLVLTQTLLLSLGELSATQHLLTAHRLYTLLERPLLELIAAETQEVERPVSVPSSFPEALTLFVNSRDFSVALVTLMRHFISLLTCHDTLFQGESWWNPEKMDTNNCCYVGLVSRVFSVVLAASDGRTASSFRPLMKLLLQVHLPEPRMLFRFLCLLWGYGRNHDDQLDLKVDAVLQTQALRMGGAILSVQTLATLEELSSADSPVIPSLMSCLSSPVRDVRRSALAALKCFSDVASSLYQPITEKLLMTSEEIIADPTYLSTALASSQVRCVQQLLQSVHTSRCPSYSSTALLRALSLVNGESILSGLLPLLDRLLDQGPDTPPLLRSEAQLALLVLAKFNHTSAALLSKDQNSLDLFIRALRTNQLHPDVPSCQISALEQITKSFFSALGDVKVQQKLLTVMFDLLLESKSPLVANTINSVFKGISVDGQLLANELCPPEKPRGTETVQQTRRSKMSLRKAQDGGEVCPEGGAVPWQRVTLILELLQHKKKVKRAETLVPVLFSLLSRSLEPSSAHQSDMDYTKQLLLSCLLNICHRLSPDGGPPAPDVLEEDKFSVELVVQCIRTSDMPQTHHHALMLLATAAAIFPEKVLHNIMPIFTFMGANILRLDDAYSFRVIDQTVQMVIPALIKAHQLPDGQSSSHVLAVVAKIIHVFADALPHVPAHRRLPVLVQLVTTLGPAHFLWVLMLLLFKLHAVQAASSTSERDSGVDSDVDLWISVCCHFDVEDIFSSIISVLKFLQKMPHNKDDKDDKAPLKRSVGRRAVNKKGEEPEEEELIFSVDAHSSKELRHFLFLSVSFTAQLLGSAAFIAKVSDEGDVMDERLQLLQQRLLEEILCLILTVARGVEENSDKPSSKFWRVLLNKVYDVLDKVNALLPTVTFITVVKGLMGNQLSSVRRKTMELLNNRLQRSTVVTFDLQQVDMLLQLIPDLLSIVGKGHAQLSQKGAEQEAEQEVEQAINRQTALYSLKLLCRNFGADHKEAFVPVLLKTVDIMTSGDEDKNVTGSALLCAAETLATIKALAIPQLPRFVPAVLHTLKDRKDLLTNEVYLLSAVTALYRLTETLPHFISPYLRDITVQVCRLTRLVDSSSSSSSSSSFVQLSLRLVSLRKTLATQLPPRVLLPALSRCYSDMVVDKKAQLGALMSVLKDHITHMEKDQLTFHQSELTSFFLIALDFRARHCQGDLEKTSEVEGHVIDCLLAMVMKLSEVTFRPLFFKLFDWSKSDSSDRLLTFYRLCDCVAERLKGLFVLFAGNLVKPFSDVLRQKHSAPTDDVHHKQKTSLLLQFVLDCLHKIFLYDTQHFLSKERADALLRPLVDQLENTADDLQIYRHRMIHHLVPCVAQFSVALSDEAEWKSLNYEILLKTRHTHSEVRFSALLMLMELASKLKENYVILLPETIPFLAELMEDECEEVEQQVHKVIQEMENILGEPLQSYF